MARMSRELSLVLLGSGILTAGYFLYSDDDELAAKQKEQVEQQVAGNNNNNNNGRRTSGGHFIWIHTGAWGGASASSGSRPVAMGGGSVSRGGFGGLGHASAGG